MGRFVRWNGVEQDSKSAIQHFKSRAGCIHSRTKLGEFMKMARREFVELLGASVASLSVGNLGFGGSAPAGQEAMELGEWKLTVAPTGDITSLTDGKVELVNSKLGDNHPRVVIDRKSVV